MNQNNFFMRKLVAFFFTLVWVLTSCRQSNHESNTSILVRSLNPGKYSILRIKDGLSFHFTNKYIGVLNKKISLPAGEYLLVIDCSSKRILFKRKRAIESQPTDSFFYSPFSFKRKDSFRVSCQSSNYFGEENKYTNRFTLNFFPKKKQLRFSEKS